MIRLIGLNEVDAIWPSIAEGMAACCKKSGGDITPDWLFMSCRRGDALLYVVEKTGRVLSEGKITYLEPKGIAYGSTAEWVEQKTLAGALIGQPQIWAEERVLRVTAFCGADMETWLEELLHTRLLSQIGIGKVVFDGRAGFLPWLQELLGKERVRVVRQVYELDLTRGLFPAH